MPQMAPLWWEVLFIIFMLTFIFMNMLIYFYKLTTPKKLMDTDKMETTQLKWKW
nr:ATP synthase subunit 8 [Plaxiscelis pagana]